jgi:ABC-type multidrug transport system fused ATPase/permease subunit
LALRSLSTSLTLGSIRLYETTAKSLFNSIRRLVTALESSFQTVFVLAAYCEALEAAHRDEWNSVAPSAKSAVGSPVKVEYEDTRLDGGMRIEAKNLSFTYPNATEPVLKGINLTIEAGETLAIVGFNGGG